MLSVRFSKSRPASWRALVFWLWLAGLVFSFAASDQLHALHCPEVLRLQWAGHPTTVSTVSAPSHAFESATECAACCFQLDSLAIFVAPALNFCAPDAPLPLARFQSFRAVPGSHFCVARGPPFFANSQFFA